MDERSGTHGARFLGDIKITVAQTPVAHRTLRLGQGDHLRVSGGVLQGLHLIPGTGDDFTFMDNDRTDRHFVLRRSLPGKAQGLVHEVLIALEVYFFFVHQI